MARLESVASGGYFPTPNHLIPLISQHLQTEDHAILIVDPCAGKGEAVLALQEALAGASVKLHLCELEQERYDQLSRTINAKSHDYRHEVLHGDAFLIDFESEPTASLLYLNPPYDTDADYGRLEERFLDRFTPYLVYHGVLVFIVPVHALKASAKTLATEYERLECYRFPEKDFEAFSQVVLFAQKAETAPLPDSRILNKVLSWVNDPGSIPVLESLSMLEVKPYCVPEWHYNRGWSLREIDFQGLKRKARPWFQAYKPGVYSPIPHVLPQVPVEQLMFREFPIATAPRPAHIASGIASGLFNGRRVTPKERGLPDLLVKGVFDREFITVDEKHNKEGEVTALLQVQQPKLVTTILDLNSKQYHTLKPAGGNKRTKVVKDMAIEDLLEFYGPSLMDVMTKQCPVKYDPKRDYERLPIASINRKLFTAQDHAARAVIQLLGGVDAKAKDRRNKAAILLGEIGSGKTSVSLAVGRTIASRMLVFCPPHLLDSWRDEVAKVIPEAEYRILQSVTDVDDLQTIPKDKFVVAVMSREAAKLGHGWTSVTGSCPKCGSDLPLGDLAKKRVRCESRTLSLGDTAAKAAFKTALQLAPYAPRNPRVESLLASRTLQKVLKGYQDTEAPLWEGFQGYLLPALLKFATHQVQEDPYNSILKKLFGKLVFELCSPEEIRDLFTLFNSKGEYPHQDIAKALWHLLPPESELKKSLKDQVKRDTWYYNRTHSEEENFKQYGCHSEVGKIQYKDGKLTLDEYERGSLEIATQILSHLVTLGKFHRSEECGEHLYQATPDPRRIALSKYLKRYPNFFDLLVLDEGHEYATDGSAQERSAHRLTATGIPTILMTGSIMNGYAASLFANMWALSEDFRKEFPRESRSQFVDRYGYLKRLISEKDKETGEIVEFGAHTDRVERLERKSGDAPGILPLFLFRHLLPFSVTLQKADLALDLPPCRQIKEVIQPSEELFTSYKTLQNQLAARIKADQFKPEVAGKLFGALAELPSYLDRATLDTGNQDDGSYQIRYPESIGGDLVAQARSFPEDSLSAKEEWMLEKVRAELAEGRNVMVFTWHVNLLPRLARLLEAEIGETVPILYAHKVPTKKRQAWIDKQVVSKGRRVMIANPVAIQTGLNNLVHFSTEIWMENPACNPIIFRQGIGRVDRIGQRLETRIYVPIYKDTLQEQLYDLLLRKVAVSVSTDGLDPESVLLATGAAESGYLLGLSIGKQLWSLIQREGLSLS